MVSQGVRSGLLAGHSWGPARPNHHPLKCLWGQLQTTIAECGGAPFCVKTCRDGWASLIRLAKLSTIRWNVTKICAIFLRFQFKGLFTVSRFIGWNVIVFKLYWKKLKWHWSHNIESKTKLTYLIGEESYCDFRVGSYKKNIVNI